jgi:Icc-related predicted phosphoesterase
MTKPDSFQENQKCILVADLHGNVAQYNTLRQIIIKEHVSFVFFAGDLLPKDGGRWHLGNTVRTIQAQRIFLENFLIDYLRDLGKYTYVYAIFGNDDFRSNYDLVCNIGDKVRFLNKEVVRLPLSRQELYVAGYPQVALTPFLHKDWEQWDDAIGTLPHKRHTIEGYDSYGGVHRPISFEYNADGRPTIAADLAKLARESDPRKTLYLMHEVPFGTPLDQIATDNSFMEDGGIHVGSRAIRAFIETEQPLLTMHGHIHETLRESGAFRWDCGNSISITPSHNYKGETLSYVMFDLPSLNNIARHTQNSSDVLWRSGDEGTI